MKILTFAFHGGYEFELAKTGQEFFRLPTPGIPPQDFGSRPVPENYRFLEQTPQVEKFDLFLADSPKKYWQTQKWDLPKVVTCHTHLTGKDRKLLQKIPPQVPKVFISHSNFRQSGLSRGFVIYHSIDTEVYLGYSGENQSVLMVGNHIADRGECHFKIFKQLVGDLPFQIVGDNPELPPQQSFKAIDYEHLKLVYRRNRVYLNTVDAPLTMGMLEAMATGMPVVSLAFGDAPLIIKNGENGFVSDDLKTLRGALLMLMENPEKARKMGENARQTIQALFSPRSFIDRWNHIFHLAVADYWWNEERKKR